MMVAPYVQKMFRSLRTTMYIRKRLSQLGKKGCGQFCHTRVWSENFSNIFGPRNVLPDGGIRHLEAFFLRLEGNATRRWLVPSSCPWTKPDTVHPAWWRIDPGGRHAKPEPPSPATEQLMAQPCGQADEKMSSPGHTPHILIPSISRQPMRTALIQSGACPPSSVALGVSGPIRLARSYLSAEILVAALAGVQETHTLQVARH